MRSDFLWAWAFFEGTEYVLELDGGLYHLVNIIKTTELYNLKWR